MRVIIFFSALLLFQVVDLHAQLPTTKMYLLEGAFTNAEWKINNLEYLTEFNPTGYNNQPNWASDCLLYTSPSPRDRTRSRMPSSA